jgi:membrane-associated phospholipid phosphatase
MQKEISLRRDPLDLFAATVALISHPVVLGLVSLLAVVFTTFGNIQDQLFYLFLLIILTFMPAALYLFVFFRGNINEMLELINREARLVPYILMILGAVGAIVVLNFYNAPKAVFVLTLVLLANEVVLGTINFWTKISIHTATATFTPIMLGYLVDPLWYIILLVVPLVAWARIYRKRHTTKQAIGGSLFAAIITSLVLVLSNYNL